MLLPVIAEHGNNPHYFVLKTALAGLIRSQLYCSITLFWWQLVWQITPIYQLQARTDPDRR
jgi:hypothetical protein